MFGINKKLKIHFIGIGGIGMSGIAETLISLGYKISGSDLNRNDSVIKIESLGGKVFQGHDRSNIKDTQIVVYSSAVKEDNPEYLEAKERRIPIIKRAEMLAELMRLKFGIAVAGSHGKTTTTSFLATIMNKLDYNPTYIIGGVVKNLGGHAKIDIGDYLIAEADESDGSFLYLNPIMSVVTNIDNDHLDHYGSIENLENAFVEFCNKVPFYGIVAINAHDKSSCKALERIKRPFILYGIAGEKKCGDICNYEASKLEETLEGARFDVTHTISGETATFKINLSGKHNVLNALGATAICHKLGSSLKDISSVIGKFEGVSRRLETLYNDKQFIVIDDYAHHPTEINATISTLKKKYDKKLVVVFEPHRFTRTQNFWKEFIDCFADVDEVYIAPIYAASEKPVDYIDSEIMVKSINERNNNAFYIDSVNKVDDVLDKYIGTESVVLTLGAGPISKVTRQFVENKKW